MRDLQRMKYVEHVREVERMPGKQAVLYVERTYVALRCPTCGSVRIKRSKWEDQGDGTALVRVNCEACGERFQMVIESVRHEEAALEVWGSDLPADGGGYAAHDDTTKPAAERPDMPIPCVTQTDVMLPDGTFIDDGVVIAEVDLPEGMSLEDWAAGILDGSIKPDDYEVRFGD